MLDLGVPRRGIGRKSGGCLEPVAHGLEQRCTGTWTRLCSSECVHSKHSWHMGLVSPLEQSGFFSFQCQCQKAMSPPGQQASLLPITRLRFPKHGAPRQVPSPPQVRGPALSIACGLGSRGAGISAEALAAATAELEPALCLTQASPPSASL